MCPKARGTSSVFLFARDHQSLARPERVIVMLCRNPRCDGKTWLCGKCRKQYPFLADSLDEKRRQKSRQGRDDRRGQASYGRNSRSGSYGSSAYAFKEATFDGYPALKRYRDGKLEFYYGPGPVDPDDATHGHAIIKNGKLIYRRPPGASMPDIDLGG